MAVMDSGNAALAGDLAVESGVALSDAIISAFQTCEDLSIPLCHEQKKQIIASCVVVITDMKERFCRVIDLDDIARNCLSDRDDSDLFSDIVIQVDDND